jgi:hypothetical protein
VGLVAYALRVFGALPGNFLTIYGTQVGSGLEMLLLSIALADRIHVMKRENEEAQAQALAASRRTERELAEKVRERVSELDDVNRMLKAEVATSSRCWSTACAVRRKRPAWPRRSCSRCRRRCARGCTTCTFRRASGSRSIRRTARRWRRCSSAPTSRRIAPRTPAATIFFYLEGAQQELSLYSGNPE